MNALQQFIAAHPCGFITDKDVPELVKLHRLCLCLVRFQGKSDGRFLCGAQYVADMVSMLEATGRHVRDVSIATSEIDSAANWKPEPVIERPAQQSASAWSVSRNAHRSRRQPIEGEDWLCTGTWDGHQCGSDADSGL